MNFPRKKKTLQTMFNAWKETGFSKDTGNTEFNRYKFARKDFRLLIKTSNKPHADWTYLIMKVQTSVPTNERTNERTKKRYQ